MPRNEKESQNPMPTDSVYGVSNSTIQSISSQDKKSQDPVSTGTVFAISSSEIPSLELAAMMGDGEIALRLSQYYGLTCSDSNQEDLWELIGAENGNDICMYNIANTFFYKNNYIFRGIYWYRTAAKNGNIFAKEQLDLLKVSYDFDDPSDLFFQSMPKYLNNEQKKECGESALKGSGVAALILAKFFRDITNENDKAEYWFRIGAQNGNNECQQIFGFMLKSKSDIINQERGNFWINRVNYK